MDRYGVIKSESQRIGEITSRTYTHPGFENISISRPESWLVVSMGHGAGELSFMGAGGADLAEEIGRALLDGAAELRERVAREGH